MNIIHEHFNKLVEKKSFFNTSLIYSSTGDFLITVVNDYTSFIQLNGNSFHPLLFPYQYDLPHEGLDKYIQDYMHNMDCMLC